MPILEIKTENLLVSSEGHQTSGARAPEFWCPQQYVLDFHSCRSQGPVLEDIDCFEGTTYNSYKSPLVFRDTKYS